MLKNDNNIRLPCVGAGDFVKLGNTLKPAQLAKCNP